AAYFDSIEHNVVGFGADLSVFACFQQRNIVSFRSCKWVMDRVPSLFFGAPLQERKFGDPKEIELLGTAHQILILSDAQPEAAEHFAGDVPLVGGKQDEIAFLNL